MRCLIISAEFPPKTGGAGIVAYNLADYFVSKQIDVEIITLRNHNRLLEKYPFSIEEICSIPKLSIITMANTVKAIRPERYDVIIANDIGATLALGLSCNVPLQKKTYIFLHGSEPEIIFEYPSFLYRLLNVQSIYSTVLVNSHKIFAVSKHMKDKFLLKTGLLTLNSKIKVFYSGIDFYKFYPDVINIKREYELNFSTKLLLSVGRIEKQKGFLIKYEIFKELLAQGMDLHWFIVGRGQFEKHLKSLVRKDSLQNRITFCGYMEGDSLRKIYSSVDVFWLLSQYEEAFGLVYIESIACGTPVLGCPNGGVSEIIKEDINGYLVGDFEDGKQKVKLALSHIWNTTLMKESIEKFNRDLTLSKLLKILT